MSLTDKISEFLFFDKDQQNLISKINVISYINNLSILRNVINLN